MLLQQLFAERLNECVCVCVSGRSLDGGERAVALAGVKIKTGQGLGT